MPAPTQKSKNYMRMAYAVKKGHTLKNVRPGTMAKLKKTAAGMSTSQLKDFATAAVSKNKKKGA